MFSSSSVEKHALFIAFWLSSYECTIYLLPVNDNRVTTNLGHRRHLEFWQNLESAIWPLSAVNWKKSN
jgi:hypothetical protein